MHGVSTMLVVIQTAYEGAGLLTVTVVGDLSLFFLRKANGQVF
jgi:hypothetical protein